MSGRWQSQDVHIVDIAHRQSRALVNGSQPRLFAFTRFTTHLTSLPHHAMPSSPEIDLGYQAGSHLTSLKRNKIVGTSLMGATLKEISSATIIPL